MYVGKTKRQLKKRISEHIQSINKKDDERPLALHFLNFHGGDPNGLRPGAYIDSTCPNGEVTLIESFSRRKLYSLRD